MNGNKSKNLFIGKALLDALFMTSWNLAVPY